MHKAGFANKVSLITLLTILLTFCPAGGAKAAYHVLVLHKDGSDLSTVWSDGTASRRLGQAIIFWNGHLMRLYTQSFSEHVTCPSGKFPFTIRSISSCASQLQAVTAKCC